IFSVRTERFFFKARKPAFLLFSLSFFVFILSLILSYSSFGEKFFSFYPLPLSSFLTVLFLTLFYFFISDFFKTLYFRIKDKKPLRINRF
ncbi:MAG: hypothetical protein ACPLZH_02825, partial [Minisyncoccales bacterium]